MMLNSLRYTSHFLGVESIAYLQINCGSLIARNKTHKHTYKSFKNKSDAGMVINGDKMTG